MSSRKLFAMRATVSARQNNIAKGGNAVKREISQVPHGALEDWCAPPLATCAKTELFIQFFRLTRRISPPSPMSDIAK